MYSFYILVAVVIIAAIFFALIDSMDETMKDIPWDL